MRERLKNREDIILNDNYELLNLMLKDQEKQSKLYHPGVYWLSKTKNAINEIKKYGISAFRGTKNAIGQSYTDSVLFDVRKNYGTNLILRIVRWITTLFPLNKIYDSQIRLTGAYASRNNIFAQEIINIKPKVRELLENFEVPYSLLGECFFKVSRDGREYSVHYLNLLEEHSNIAKYIDFNKVYSVFEIGGGFGTNIHLLLENYPNIKKVLYLDIPPNLYVGTQYLKAFYGDLVIDYSISKDLDEIKFSTDDNLEIFCIAPWQIEKFQDSVDVFMNSHSFVEMPKDIVKNYIDKLNDFPKSINTAISLTSYDYFDVDTTIDPNELPNYFQDREFNCFESEQLLDSSRKNIYYVSPGVLELDN